ncbi:MAG: 2-C-methyl-D-erythritol 4-phosphate cytidylyltransferase [bacterium]|nr:2-C-methyl-D-erythritol 4-phosphate cytidylyltransferase [bacterium]
MTSLTHVSAIIVAAGKGERMGSSMDLPKQFLPIGGVPILAHTLNTFALSKLVDEIVLVTRPEFRSQCEALIQQYRIQKVSAVTAGGKERKDSVWRGLQAADSRTEIVLIHDAVRMFVSQAVIAESVQGARRHGAAIAAVPAKDTIKQIILHAEGDQTQPSGLFVEKTFDRSVLWQIQTPQTFQFDLIRQLHERAAALDLQVTDDAMLAEHFGHSVKIVPGSYRNIKITTSDDLLIAEAFWQDEQGG